MTSSNRIDLLSMVIRDYNDKNEIQLPSRLVDRFKHACLTYSETFSELAEIEEELHCNRQQILSMKQVSMAPQSSPPNHMNLVSSGTKLRTKCTYKGVSTPL